MISMPIEALIMIVGMCLAAGYMLGKDINAKK